MERKEVRPKYNNHEIIDAWASAGITERNIKDCLGVSLEETHMIAAGRRLPTPELVERSVEVTGTGSFLDTWAHAFAREAERRIKLSVAHTGKTHSPEARAKMSVAHTGKTHSPEARAKMSVARTGKTHSPEARAKMSVAHTNPSPEARAKMSAAHNNFEGMDPENSALLFYLTLSAKTTNFNVIANQLGVSLSLLSHYKSGRRFASDRFIQRVLAVYPPAEQDREFIVSFLRPLSRRK